ncbi:hypothetical protein PMA3_24960 [Pseudomonas silesiensis]|uniref:Uncharacterized protein n=1 Tax=Pseudomonas silesiensis TaxID=1853130 RepID=A0A191YZQ2_9PSED|nr:hypothetical protein [Pseudomonas silesiensis]ANJ58244.1 hypothetical protein PMA3_24960 [Pseudomonas silesiensis]
MIVPLIKNILCFIAVCLLVILYGVYWFASEAKEAWWVVERFGGMEVINDKSISPEGIDRIYMRSLYLKPQQDVVRFLEAREPCLDFNQYCMQLDSAVINLHLNKTGVVLDYMDDFFGKYEADVNFFEGGCPIVLETTMVVKEVVALRELSARKARAVAREKMKKIKEDGGLIYSLDTPACKRFFRKKPYFARGYIGHLTFLMEVAEGRFAASWRYLGAMRSIQSTLAVMPSKHLNVK